MIAEWADYFNYSREPVLMTLLGDCGVCVPARMVVIVVKIHDRWDFRLYKISVVDSARVDLVWDAKLAIQEELYKCL